MSVIVGVVVAVRVVGRGGSDSDDNGDGGDTVDAHGVDFGDVDSSGCDSDVSDGDISDDMMVGLETLTVVFVTVTSAVAVTDHI